MGLDGAAEFEVDVVGLCGWPGWSLDGGDICCWFCCCGLGLWLWWLWWLLLLVKC